MAKRKSRATRFSEAQSIVEGANDKLQEVLDELNALDKTETLDENKYELIEKALNELEDARSQGEELRDELQEWRDNLPDNLQNGSKADDLDSAIAELDPFVDGLDQVPEFTKEEFNPESLIEEGKRTDLIAKLEEAIGYAEDAGNASPEFPRMFG